MDDDLMCTLGIIDDVYCMVGNLGWTEFINMRFPTYERLKLEFLGSIDVHVLYWRIGYTDQTKEKLVLGKLFDSLLASKLLAFIIMETLKTPKMQRDP